MITQQDLRDRMKSYDFEKNSIKQLSIETGVSTRTIKRYMIKMNIPGRYNVIVNNPRDNLGRYCFKNIDVDGLELNIPFNKREEISLGKNEKASSKLDNLNECLSLWIK